MGHIHHNQILVHSFEENAVRRAHRQAKEIFKRHGFDRIISPIQSDPVNAHFRFVVYPSGSKDGWSEALEHHAASNEFIQYVQEANKDRDEFVQAFLVNLPEYEGRNSVRQVAGREAQ